MKAQSTYLRRASVLGLLFLLLLCCGCGEYEVYLTGTVTDKLSKQPLEGVAVQPIVIMKKEDSWLPSDTTDSLGQYFTWEFLGCGLSKCRFVAVFAKEGYKSQVLDFEPGDELNIELEME